MQDGWHDSLRPPPPTPKRASVTPASPSTLAPMHPPSMRPPVFMTLITQRECSSASGLKRSLAQQLTSAVCRLAHAALPEAAAAASAASPPLSPLLGCGTPRAAAMQLAYAVARERHLRVRRSTSCWGSGSGLLARAPMAAGRMGALRRGRARRAVGPRLLEGSAAAWKWTATFNRLVSSALATLPAGLQG